MRKVRTRAKFECSALMRLCMVVLSGMVVRRGLVVCGGLVVGSGLVACNGQLGPTGADEGNGPGRGDGPTSLSSSEDPGFKGIHRLNSREYDNTIRDLLGAPLRPGASFLNETAHGFDNVASVLGMTSNQYAAYFRAASDVAENVFEDPSLIARIVTCETQDAACASDIISRFGTRAFRRPLLDEEVGTFLGVYDRAVGLGLSHREAIQQVVRAFLSSAEFLYRMEFDENPDSIEPHEVSSYELASRLSYFLWGTMPDQELLDRAEDGSLSDDETLDEQVSRMLQSPLSQSLVDDFAAQWLGMKALQSHAVLSDVFPEWNDDLRNSMLVEASMYVNDYVRGSEPWREFLVGDFTYVNARLGEHYGVTGMTGDFQRTDLNVDGRTGFMGLGAFLTVSSFSHRTAPTLRAVWILEELLCSPPPPPPDDAVVAELDDGDDIQNQAAQIENIRERLELHRSDPGCASCHKALDPLGMALEHYDAIGRYRDAYENGDPIDPSGEMPDGTAFDGLQSLAHYLAGDERFVECSTEKLLTYGVGRHMEKSDKAHIQSLAAQWEQSGDETFQGLVKAVINSVPFRERRGGSE